MFFAMTDFTSTPQDDSSRDSFLAASEGENGAEGIGGEGGGGGVEV